MKKLLLILLTGLFHNLRNKKNQKFSRVLPFGEYISDRWEKARYLGFGKGTSVYDSAAVFGDVSIGERTWIGPGVILDGTGGLEIGNNCSIACNAQLYSHDTVQWAITGGKAPYEYAKTKIGNNCYIGPNVVVIKGINIGNSVTIGANSFVNQNVPDGAKAYGNPIVIKSKK